MVKAFVICPNESIGDMMAFDYRESAVRWIRRKRWTRGRVMLTSFGALNEILIDFHDRIKSMTRGYGSMDYEHAGITGSPTW